MGSVNMDFVQFFNPRSEVTKPSHRPAHDPLPIPPSLPPRPSSSLPAAPSCRPRTTQSLSCQLPLNSCPQSTAPIHNIPGLPRKPTQQPKTVLRGASRDIEPQDLSACGSEEYRHESGPSAIRLASSAPVECPPRTDSTKHCENRPLDSLQAPVDRPNPPTAGEARDRHCDRVPGGALSFEQLQNEKENKNSNSIFMNKLSISSVPAGSDGIEPRVERVAGPQNEFSILEKPVDMDHLSSPATQAPTMANRQTLPSLEAPIVLNLNIGSLDASNDSLHTEQEPLDHEPLTSLRSPTQARQFSPGTRSRQASNDINHDNVSSNPAGAFALPVGPLTLGTNRQAMLNDETSDLSGGQLSIQQMDTSESLGCSTPTSANCNVGSSENIQDEETLVSDLVESSVNECGLPIQSGSKRSRQEDLEPSDSSSNVQLSPAGCNDIVLEDHAESRAPKKQKKSASNALPHSVGQKVQPSTISPLTTLQEQASQKSANEDESRDSDDTQRCPSSFRYPSANPEPGPGAEYYETPFSGVIKRTTIGHDTYYSLEFKSNALSACFPQFMSLLASTSPAVTLNTMGSTKISPRKRYTPEDDKKIIRLKEEGLTWEDIADQFPDRSSTALHVRYCTKLKGKPSALKGRGRNVPTRGRKSIRRTSPTPSATESESDGDEEWPLTNITKSRTMQNGSVQYRVCWDDGAQTWEPYDNVKDTKALEEFESSRRLNIQRKG